MIFLLLHLAKSSLVEVFITYSSKEIIFE